MTLRQQCESPIYQCKALFKEKDEYKFEKSTQTAKKLSNKFDFWYL